MISSLVKKHIFLILALLSFATALVSSQLLEENSPKASEKHYGEAVQKKVLQSLKLADTELTEITGLFQKSNTVNFAALNSETTFPYFIFKAGKLIYWSDHRYIPEYNWISGIFNDGLLAKSNHISLVKKQSFYYRKEKVELVSLIPVYQKYRNENDYLKSGFEKRILPTSPLTIENTASSFSYLNIHDANERFLFSVVPPRTENLNSSEITLETLILMILGFAFLGIYCFLLIRKLITTQNIELAAFILLSYLVLTRWFMLANSLPFSSYEWDLFNPKFFAINSISPSLGDLIVNVAFLGIFVFFFVAYFYRSKIHQNLIRSSSTFKSVISVINIVLSVTCTYYIFNRLSSIYENSSFLLDLSFSTSFSNLKIAAILFFILLGFVFFLTQHFLINTFSRINVNKKTGFIHWLYGSLLAFFILIYLDQISWVYLLGALYFLIVYYFKLTRFLHSFKYNTSIYFFLGAFVYTLITVLVIRNESVKKNVFDKQNYGLRYLAENDALGEGLLTKVIQGIKADTNVQNSIKRELLPKQAVEALVKEKHLDLYFDKYNTSVLSFDRNGKQLGIEEDLPNLLDFVSKYKQEKYKTDNPNIYFVNETGIQFIKQYIVFVPLKESSGTVVLDLKQRDGYAESVYPELLMEKRFVQNPDSKNYSYAIFNEKDELVFTSGRFNYLKSTDTKILSNPKLFTTGLQIDDYDHLGVKGQNGRKIIISSERNIIISLLSDFSFLYLFLVLIISFLILIYAIRIGLRRLRMNFSTKIQIYLNAAFLLPFLLILFAIIGVIRSTLLTIQSNFYLENTKNIGSTVRLHLQNLDEGKSSPEFFKQEINKLAQDTKSDINYFDLDGRLAYSSRPLIYEYNLLSNRVNSSAYQAIIEEHENEILLKESLGELKYKAVYLSIKDKVNKPLGVIGIPFFDSSNTLELQLKEVFTTILSICIALFLILLVLSYFASNHLTNPLKMVARKITKTSLNKQNEPIVWEADDEIGVLTKSYNNMLKMLEESKDALSQSEKQTAWREMAKQVAHEIKNPLTPMKLSIQQLQRTLPSLDEKSQKRIERALGSLTEQIDNISEIANSFSEFAKMPVPRSEVFELASLVQKTSYLYAQNNKVDVSFTSEEKELYVRSDHQLINRVVTNLVINGIQSVTEDRKPKIEIKVYRNDKDKFAIIEVKDNGSGIPENVRNKVFIPNFSTKIGGSGLGLAMAKRGVEHSGGNIWFETEIGQGTTFYVDLPLANEA